MKKEGVWDNTTVVLASDHSAGDDPAYSNLFNDTGMGREPTRSNALLMIKKVGQTGEFKTDATPMTAAKAASLWNGG